MPWGAATWGSGTAGVIGGIDWNNSLVGTDPSDRIAGGIVRGALVPTVTALTNGNYVVASRHWSSNRGAATWGDGTSGMVGDVSDLNSLVGTDPADYVSGSADFSLPSIGLGSYGGGVTALTNGNYVVSSPNWNGTRGAASWGNGGGGTTGAVSSSNSLVGTTARDYVSGGGLGNISGSFTFLGGVTPLSNSHYVVGSPFWNGGLGAATWSDGAVGSTGPVTTDNSLHGTNPGDRVGAGATALTNGNYVVSSPTWDGTRGAATWGNGAGGITGPVDSGNSLVGNVANDRVGGDRTTLGSQGLGRPDGVFALANGHYVVSSPNWRNGTTNSNSAGAVTWGSGWGDTAGFVTADNSIVGTSTNDRVGVVIAPLSTGSFVVGSPNWNNSAGAATWGSGLGPVSGPVSVANSLTGSNQNERVGEGVLALADGNYVVRSPGWSSRRGAATWGNGTTGRPVNGSNTISMDNSLIGGTTNAGLDAVVENPVYKSFWAAFTTEPVRGRVAVGFVDPIHYASDFLVRTLATGANVVLQACNDITVNSPILVDNPTGDGGSLTLKAGRSILLNASITTDNGALTLIANNTVADGVTDALRNPGNAVITMADGVVLDTGTGPLTVELRDGGGLTNPDSGAITLQTVTAGSLSVTNNGPSAGSDVVLGSVTTAGAQTYSNLNGTTVVTGNLTTTDSPLTFTDAVLLNAGLTLSAGSSSVLFAGLATVAPGVLTVAGGVALSNSATFSVTLNGTDPASYSQVHASGPIDLGGSTLSLTLGFTPSVGDSFTLLSTDDSSPVTGTFAGLDEGAMFSQGELLFQITYQGGPGGNSVVLTRLA